MNYKTCLYCGKIIEKRRKYCNKTCLYRYNSIKNEKIAKFSVSQFLRMVKAGRKQRSGKLGVRFN